MADAMRNQYFNDDNQPSTEGGIVYHGDDKSFLNQLNFDIIRIREALYVNPSDTFLSDATIKIEILPNTILMFKINPAAIVQVPETNSIRISEKPIVEVALAAIQKDLRNVSKHFIQTMNVLRISSQREIGLPAQLTMLSMAIVEKVRIMPDSLIIFDSKNYYSPSRTYTEFGE